MNEYISLINYHVAECFPASRFVVWLKRSASSLSTSKTGYCALQKCHLYLPT